MAYKTLPVKDLARGIDQRSSPNAIGDGYAEVLENVDTNPNGSLSKRPGYEGYAGFLPLRVQSIVHDGTRIKFNLDGSIDAKNAPVSPIVVYGRTGTSHTGDFSTTDTARYYPTFTTDVPDTLTSPSGTYSFPETRHGVAASQLLVGGLVSTSTSDNSNSDLVFDGVAINATSAYDIDIDYTVPSDTNAYIFVQDASDNNGTTYSFTDTVSGATTDTLTVDAATHALDTFNLVIQTYVSNGTEWELVEPDSVEIDSVGEVSITLTNSTASTWDVQVVILACPATQEDIGSIGAGVTDTIVLADAEPFYFLSVYQDVAGVKTKVFPDSVVFNDTANTITVTLTNSGATSSDFYVYWDYADVTSSTIIVEDTAAVSTNYTDTETQLTIWGLPHTEIYSSPDANEGHVVHLDSYTSEGVSHLISGLGGNLFVANSYTENGTGHKYGSSRVKFGDVTRVSPARVIAPFFVPTGGDLAATRGHVESSDVDSDYYATVTAATVSVSGQTTYTLSLTSKAGTLANLTAGLTNLANYLTVTGMTNPDNNGWFKILSVDNTANTITVENTTATDSSFDEVGCLGKAGVFTDYIALSPYAYHAAGDKFSCSAFDGTLEVVSVETTPSQVVVKGLTSAISLPANVRLNVARTSNLLFVTSALNFVKGDMVSVTGFSRKFRVEFVRPSTMGSNTITSFVGDGTTATITTSGVHYLRAGQVIYIYGSTGQVTGEYTVATVPTTTTFTAATTVTATSANGTILANCIQIDEEIEVSDGEDDEATVQTHARWLPAEAPETTDDLPATTYYRHMDKLDYNSQVAVRSAPIKDSLYLTNHQDEVVKFDGTNLYQAGLFRWQPHLFAQVDTGTASLTLSSASAAVSAVSANKFTVGTGETAQFAISQRVTHSQNNATYTVIGLDDTNNFVYVDTTVSGTGSGTLKRVKQYRGYFRLNAIDANQNIVASAVTGAQDFVVDLSAAGQIRMRLLAPPAFGNYDYDTWELQYYRTKANTSGPYYLNRNVDVAFDQDTGYIDIFDGTPDEVLVDFDVANTALKGAELGTAWTQPPRAKTLTTLNNKLVLGNIKDYPELDITLRKAGNAAAIAASDLAGKILLLRKDKDDAGTATNMVDRVNYEFRTSGAVTITPATDIARTSTTFVITKVAHGLVVGNWVYLYHAAAGSDNDLHFAGWWQIASKTDDTFTVNFANDFTVTAADVDTYVAATNANDIPVWLGTDGNINQLDGNTINEFTAMVRLSNAINASQRLTDTSVSGFTTFKPWVVANAGSEYGVGRVVLRQEQVFDDVFEAVLPTTPTTGQWFAQQVLRAGGSTVQASTKLFPSRVAVSYENFPEIFDDPYGDFSEMAVDINPADNQEVTAVFPFFGDSVFGSGQVEDFAVVFKSYSIYMLNLKTMEYSKIDSRGLGCTAPMSVGQVNGGIAFANEAGIFRLNRDLSVSPIGDLLERTWQDDVNKTYLSTAVGHHYGVGNRYKLSVPTGDDQDTNNTVLVYDYQREGKGQEYGAWTTYTNHHTTNWCNLGKEAYWSSTDGQVFRVRNSGTSTDYRDDAAGIAAVVTLKAEDFGLSGERKSLGGIVSHFHLRRTSMTGTAIAVSTDLDGNFRSAGTLEFTKGATNKVEKANSSLPQRKAEFFQVKYTNSVKDEDFILAGLDYRVAGLNEKNIRDAADT